MLKTFTFLLAALSIGLAPGAASAQTAKDYPNKPIHLVAPIPPGGSTDVLLRDVARRLQERWGQPAVVENKPGGAASIGTAAVARAPADGYTLLYSTAGNLIQAPFVMKDPPFHAVKDFTPILGTTKTVGILAVNPAFTPVSNVKELVEWGKRNPGKLTISNPGIGSAYYMGVELLNKLAGAGATNVPFKGGAESLTAVVAGEVAASIGSVTNASVFVKQGRLRLLAVIEGTRYSRLPDLPTVGESIPGFALPVGFHGFLGPAGLPRSIVNQLNTELIKALKLPEVEKRMAGFGLDIVLSGPEEFGASIRSDYELFARIVKLLDIKPE